MRTLRAGRLPSSSKAKLPHSPRTVPSSTSVTRDSPRARRWPGVDRGVLDDVVGLEAVAARLVEQDAAAAAGEDDGDLAGRGRAGVELGQGAGGGGVGDVLDGVRSKSSKPSVRASDSYPVCMPVSPLATHRTLKRVRTWSSWTKRPSEFATRTRRRLSPTPTWTWVMASPARRAASSARGEELELAGLVDAAREGALAAVVVGDGAEGDRARASAALGGRRRRRPGRRRPGPARRGRRCGRSRSSRRRRRGCPPPGNGRRRALRCGGHRGRRPRSRRPRRRPRPCRHRRTVRSTGRVRARQGL